MSVDFKLNKGIFLQIADNIGRQILEGILKPGDRVPSIRDLASDFEVNRNTVLRTYAILSDAGIIENKRGIGFFVADDAVGKIQEREKSEFFKNDLPEFINKVKLLKLNRNDLRELLIIINNNENENK
jgi:DNA-binding transcriptional regulator YhcF (GntR family)